MKIRATNCLLAAFALSACGNGDDNSVAAPASVHLDASVRDGAAMVSGPNDAASQGDAGSKSDADDVGDARPPPVADPHPAAMMTTADLSAMRTLPALCLAGMPDREFHLCPTNLCCVDNSTCQWDQCSVAPAGHILINMLSSVLPDAGPSGAAVSTITSAPFHGLCFVKPGAMAPEWCETVAPVGGVTSVTEVTDAGPLASQDLGVLVTVSSALAGSPPYQYEVCYLPGTLHPDTTAGSSCADMGGYCCYPPHSMGPLDTKGLEGVPAGDYYFGFHSMPDISTAGPVPFGTWGPNGVISDVP